MRRRCWRAERLSYPPSIRVHLRASAVATSCFGGLGLHDCAHGCYKRAINRDDIIARLLEYEAALCARGVTHAALFGSHARGDARPDSDTDIMIEIDLDAPVTVSVASRRTRLGTP